MRGYYAARRQARKRVWWASSKRSRRRQGTTGTSSRGIGGGTVAGAFTLVAMSWCFAHPWPGLALLLVVIGGLLALAHVARGREAPSRRTAAAASASVAHRSPPCGRSEDGATVVLSDAREVGRWTQGVERAEVR